MKTNKVKQLLKKITIIGVVDTILSITFFYILYKALKIVIGTFALVWIVASEANSKFVPLMQYVFEIFPLEVGALTAIGVYFYIRKYFKNRKMKKVEEKEKKVEEKEIKRGFLEAINENK